MKTLRKLCAAVLLTSVLAVSANAGDMWTGYTNPPPPPPPSTTGTTQAPGEISAGITETMATLLDVALSML